jgi:hypothetical protein
MAYDMRINTTFKTWDPQSDEELDAGACGRGCSSHASLDTYNGYTVWQCYHGSWFIPQEQQTASRNTPHHHSECPGNCSQHPLLTGDVLEMTLRMREAGPSRTTWGDMQWEDELAERARETPAQTAARLAADAEHERKGKEGVVRYLVHRKEEKWTRGGEMKFRVPRPCKYATLYANRTCSDCGAKVPEGATVCKAMKGHRVCDQEFAGCWNHEQTRTCIYVHPDEPQWADACSGALCYDRQASCFHLRGQEPAQVNRFVAAARNEGVRMRQDDRRPPRHEERPPREERHRREHNHTRYGGGARQDDGWEQTGPRRVRG